MYTYSSKLEGRIVKGNTATLFHCGVLLHSFREQMRRPSWQMPCILPTDFVWSLDFSSYVWNLYRLKQ